MLSKTLKSRSTSRAVGAPKPTVGWREWVGLPLLGIEKIKAKIDTGARTSALHAYDVSSVRRQGREFVRFKVHPLQKNTRRVVECEVPLLEWRQVTDSSGRRTLRPVIRTTLAMGGRVVQAEVTLIARDQMGFRMLVGREALKSRWLVDPSKSFIGSGKDQSGPRRRKVRTFEEE
jgi:hypothetical protein